MRSTVALVLMSVATSCGTPPCADTLPWGAARVASGWDGHTLELDWVPGSPVPLHALPDGGALLLDTGFSKSAVRWSALAEIDGVATLNLGGRFSDVQLVANDALPEGVLVAGAEVVRRIPLTFDFRRRRTRILWEPTPLSPAAPPAVSREGRCAFGQKRQHLLVGVVLSGVPRLALLDTGGALSWMHSSLVPDDSAFLDDVAVQTGFGARTARVFRQGPVLLGSGRVDRPAWGTAPEADAFLEAQGEGVLLALGGSVFQDARLHLGGDLDPRVELDTADASGTLQGFVGIGVNLSTAKEGFRVVGFWSASPAREAGMRPDDIIVAIDGQAAFARPPPWLAGAHRFEVLREGAALVFDIEARQLLP